MREALVPFCAAGLLIGCLPFQQAQCDERVEDVTLDSGRTLVFFPTTQLYPHYAADPHRSAFALRQLFFLRTDIPDSTDNRFGLKLGGRLGLLTSHPPDKPERGWQISADVGLNAQFDNGHNQDNVGWDGRYGVLFTARPNAKFALMTGLLHVSSHVGDEYAERTGRQRINYTREEFALGLAVAPRPNRSAYIEFGWAYLMNNPDLQERGRIQGGFQIEQPARFWANRMGWYAALDVSAMEERDWRVDTAAQLGLLVRTDGRAWRAALEWVDGRPSIGEFFDTTERHIGLGLWLDL